MKRLQLPVATLVVALMFVTSVVNAAPTYIQSKPLTQVIKTPVGKVVNGTAVTVPLITWGGDINTIYANGNSRTTRSGSIFEQQGLKFTLKREDVFSKQVENYLSGKSPYLRGTLGMINMAADLLNRDPRTAPVIIYQHTESSGGDALVVKSGIKTAKDLVGKTIAVQAYGPHVDYLAKVLSDARLSVKDVKIKWLPDLTGTDNTPMAALYERDVDAAMVIIPDALALTSGGNVGTGSELSVKGASILLSTKTANRIIADVYAVRADYFKSHRNEVEAFVRGLLKGEEKVKSLMANRGSMAKEHRSLMRASASILLDAEDAVADAEGLYADAEHMGYSGNVKFFTDRHYPRSMERRNKEIQQSLAQLGMVSGRSTLSFAGWDFAALKSGLRNTARVETPRFDQQRVAAVVAKKQQQGTLSSGELFSFEVYFQPNQQTFPVDMYEDAFKQVIDLAATYGGALITVEGHSDPMGYLRKKKAGESQVLLARIKQSARNLSLTRAAAVRDEVINYARRSSQSMDESQFAIVGHGLNAPKSGICGSEPCAPKTKQEWQDNMRVVFRIIQVEAESVEFSPL